MLDSQDQEMHKPKTQREHPCHASSLQSRRQEKHEQQEERGEKWQPRSPEARSEPERTVFGGARRRKIPHQQADRAEVKPFFLVINNLVVICSECSQDLVSYSSCG